MKKRTLVCFLIFTLCVFYTAMPNTVFGQEEGVALAKQVFDEHGETLQRDDVKALLPEILNGLQGAGDDVDIPGLIDTAIALINAGSGATLQALAAGQGVTLTDDHITLLADADVQTLLTAETTKQLLGLKGAELQAGLAELLRLANEPVGEVTPPPEEEVTPPPEEVTPPPEEEVTPPPEEVTPPPEVVISPAVAIAKQVFDEHSQTLQRDDVKALLPEILNGLQGAGDDVDIPGLVDTAITLINAGSGATLQALAAQQGVTLTDAHITLLADADVQTLLTAETTKQLLGLKGAELQAGLAELLRLANEPVDDGTTPPDDGTTPPDDGTTPPDDGTTPPDDGTTPPDDGTTPPDDGTTPPDDGVVPPPEIPKADRFEDVTPTRDYLLGQSRLGGLSLNNASGRRFVDGLINAVSPVEGLLEAEIVVDAVLDAVPKGFLPKRQIRQILLSKRLSAFPQEASQLDAENFGNAIMPNFTDFFYTDFGDAPNQKYLTSDGLHVYTRVPAKVAGVEFSLSGGTPVPGTEVTMDELGADTIPYTFRLEETLAATNLPAWPDLDAQLFDGVTLRYSNDGPMGEYIGVEMDAVTGATGVVWETKLGLPAGGSTYYYFVVDLAEDLTFTALDREAIAALDPTTVTLADVLNPAHLHQITITGWAMPDPRNLQLADRGIVDQLFTPNLARVFSQMLASPQVLNIAAKAIAGQQVDINEILNVATPKQLRRIQSILGRNAEALITRFETEFDPMLASVFTVPRVNLETHSLWTARIDSIADGNYWLKADVLADDGTVLDRVQENITVDTSAPEADIGISPGDANATGYMSDDGIYVATVETPGTAASLNIMGMPKIPGEVGPGRGYLLYQMIALDENGDPYIGEPSIQKPNTWMPLTVDSTMLVSNIWDAVRQAVAEGRIDAPTNLTLQAALALPLEGVLGILNAGMIQQFADPILRGLEPFIGFNNLNPEQAQLIVDALGTTIDIIDRLVPVTFDPSGYVAMPIQGAQMPLAVGDYGIRAMGLDSLFNVGAYAAPQHLRIVTPVYDKAAVTAASIGDRNGDGVIDEKYEIGTIYSNTTDGVMLTGTIDLTGHPITSVLVQYEDASGNWQDIGEATVMMDGTFEISWDVSDFEALLAAGNTVNVQAIATNKLQLTDPEPMASSINLDAGFYPPKVLALAVDETSITSRNFDSEGPQGTVTVNAYTLSVTGPRTGAVRFEAKRESDADWKTIGTADQGVVPQNLADAIQAAIGLAAGGADASVDASGYLEWSITVDTTTLEDTITKDSPAARDASKDDNQYTIRAFAVSADATEWPSDATTMLSVDNVDDVEPLGPTNITVAAEADPDGGYTLHGLVDENDPSVVPQTVMLTIEPTAERKTYKSVMLVSDPVIDAALVGAPVETSEGSGVFEITVNIGELGIAGNGTYTLHALAYDQVEPEPNVQTDPSPERTIHVKNYERPDPAVFKLMVDVGTQKNIDSGGPQGTFTFTGYTIEQNSPPIESIRLEAKRANDTEWATIGTGDASTSVDIEDAALPGVLDHLTGIAVEGTEAGNRSVVAIDATNKQWVVSVDTTALEDTITKDSPAARDASKDDNQYTVRAFAVDASGTEWASDATAMFSLDNVDDVAPLEPTSVSVTSVDGVDVVFETADDGSFTVGGLVDKYDDAVASPVATFTIQPVAKRETYKSVKFMADAEGALISEITETAEGSGVFTVTVDVGTLADGETYLENGTYTFQALAFDEFDNVEADTDGSKASVTVENSYRPAPEVLVIAVDPESITQTNPDSGAPQGTITLNTRSHEITSPPISGMRIEVKRPTDEAWIDVGTATESMMVSDVSDAELADFVGDIASAAVSETEASESGEATVVPINRSQTYQEWMLEVDTTTLEDTITADSPAARDASKDDNQYMVRVTAIAEADGSETMSPDGITAHFSVDNVDDVEPLGPTNIVAVADVAGMIEANEDGSYTVGGIVDPTVSSPIATFTIEQTADPITYEGGSVNLVQTTADGTETTTEGEAGVLDTITIDVGTLENGTYMFHALTVDKFGNVQTDESPQITVHVLNFRVSDITDLAVSAVDGTDVAESPAEPIPLRDSVTVSFMVANGSLAAEELSGEVNGGNVPNESAEDPENTFSLMVELKSPADGSPLPDGVYTPAGVVTKRNGSIRFPLTTVNLDNTGPMITIESPTDGEAVDSLPTIHATYHDGEGIGVDGATGSVTLVRMQPPNQVEVVVDQAALEKDAEDLVYTVIEQLPGGAYTVTVEVTDLLGTVGTRSREFTVNGTVPTVAIHSPATGNTFDHGEPLISGEFSGAGSVEITTFTINDVDATPEVDGNLFSYTPEEALTNGSYTVVVEITDANGAMAQATVTFMVDIPEPPKDTTPPVISAVAPIGTIKDADHDKAGSAKISAVVTDEQSAISSVKYSINGGQLRSISGLNIAGGKIEAPIDFEAHGPGLYNIRLVATSQGGTTEHTWSFTLVVDNIKPTITSITPSGTVRGGLPVISASANDESGVAQMTITVWDSDGEEVNGNTEDDGEDNVEGITRVDFNLEEPLDEGVYTIEVRATDPYENSTSAKRTFTIDFDTAAPVITMASPQNEARLTNRRPLISIAYADAESGVDVDSIRFIFNSNPINLPKVAIEGKTAEKTASQVLYRPETDLPFGQHTVRIEVSDMAHKEGNVSEKGDGAREANMAAYEFTFFVESKEGPILASRPINFPNPFESDTHISFSLTRQSTVSIVIYDSTLRPVRVLRNNDVLEAGNYTGKDAIYWDGKTFHGNDLARGIYFCEIIVADGFEPEFAILKLALTR